MADHVEVLLGKVLEQHERALGDLLPDPLDRLLPLLGETRPLTVELAVDGDGALTGTALIKQSEWGIKPYSTLFGALKVADEVRVEFEGRLAR